MLAACDRKIVGRFATAADGELEELLPVNIGKLLPSFRSHSNTVGLTSEHPAWLQDPQGSTMWAAHRQSAGLSTIPMLSMNSYSPSFSSWAL